MDNLMPSISQRQITEDIPIAEWENPYFTINEPEEMAVSIADRYISIQTCTDGYDYTIYDAEFKELDGGVYDDPDISIHVALNELVSDLKESSVKGIPNTELQGNVQKNSKVVSVDYEELVENAESVAQNAIAEQKAQEVREKAIVSDFKAKTNEMFHDIKGQTPEEIEQTIYAYVRAKMDEYDTQASIVDVVVAGSRCRGLESNGSDLDVIVEFKGNEREDDFFHLVHEDGLTIGGVPVDINPITEGKTGTLATYLPQVETYLTEKAEQQTSMETEHIQENTQHEKVEEQPKITVTLTVAECSEFHNLGEFHEGIESVDEALAIYNRIPPEHMRGIRGIGINLHTEGMESYEDVGLNILTGHTIDIEILDYVPDIKNNAQAMALIKELSEKVENVEILGTFPKPVDQAKQLAIEIDQFSYDYDTYEYKDNVSDREAQLAMLTEDISNGQADYLQDFLQDVIEDAGLAENVRKAQELSQKLSEYKPLAKIEEMEEQNYNMVDNVLNNGAGEKKQEKRTERVSIKERLSQKKAEIEQKHKGGSAMIEKESEKKTEREI